VSEKLQSAIEVLQVHPILRRHQDPVHLSADVVAKPRDGLDALALAWTCRRASNAISDSSSARTSSRSSKRGGRHCTARADDRTLVGDVIAVFAVDGEEPLPGPLLGG
jgi:hypothetical protein